jgi:hypothetical protein
MPEWVEGFLLSGTGSFLPKAKFPDGGHDDIIDWLNG